MGWRDHLRVHPAANLFPLMSESELRDLKADIEKNGLQSPIVLYDDQLLDGRHRLDALDQLGIIGFENGCIKWTSRRSRDCWDLFGNYYGRARDPYDLVVSLNVHRRHLTSEQKRDLIAKVLKAKPGESNRKIAKQTKVDHKTVAVVRGDLESSGEIPQLEKTVGKDGKARAKPKKPTKKQEERDREECIALHQKVVDAEKELTAHRRTTGSAEVSIEQRTAEYAALDDQPLAALRREYAARTAILTIPERRKELIAIAHRMGFDIEIKGEPTEVNLAIPGFRA